MNAALWKKAVRESQWLLLICAVGLFLFCSLRIWIVSTVEMSRFAAIIGEPGEDIEKFSTVPLAHLLTYAGRIAVVYNEPLVLLIVSVWAVSRGSDVVSGEIGRGTMEMLLAQPTSRLQILLSQGVVGVVGVFVLCIASWAGSASGIYYFHVKEQPPAPSIRVPGVNFKIPLPFLEPTSDEPVKTPLREKVDPRVLLPAVTNLASLGLFLLGLTTLFSALDHQRWRTIGAASTLWVVSLAAKAIGMAVEQARWLNYCSFFTPYSPEWAVYVGMHKPDMAARLTTATAEGAWQLTPLGHNALLLALAAACFVAAGVVFCRRDLPAPL